MEKLLSKLNNEIINTFHHLDLFKKLSDIIDENSQLREMDTTLLQWMKKAFTVDLVICIGRICDKHKKSNSLVQFLRILKEKDEYLTRQRYIKLCNSKNSLMLELANRGFDSLAGKGSNFYQISKIDADISKITIENPCKKIIDFRNQYIAHSDKKKSTSPPTFEELFKTFEIIKDVFKKYNLLIRSTNIQSPIPIIQSNWNEVLTIPWIPKHKNKLKE